MAAYFEKSGKKVPWQKLGKEFDNHQFCFQVLDQEEYGDWQDELKRLLDEA